MDPLLTGLLPALRQYVGLPQSRMAEWLGISRVQLAQAERGIRPLPPAGQRALAAWVAALPPALVAALALGQESSPPALPAPAAEAPDAATLAPRRRRLGQELRRLEAERRARFAEVAQGEARLALLALPGLPDLGEKRPLFELEAGQWTSAFARATLLLLTARCAGLRQELAVLDAGDAAPAGS